MRATLGLIAVSVVVFIVQLLYSSIYVNPVTGLDPFTETFSLTASKALGGAWWQFITYMFLHANTMHIFLNMFALLMFGVIIERALGWKKYIFLYLASGVGSAIFYLFLMGLFGGNLSAIMLGASGAVYGILAAFGFMFPKEVIYIYFIPLPAISAVFLLAAVEFILGITTITSNVWDIANFGHLGGIITSALVMLVWKHTMRPKNESEMRQYKFYWE